MSTDEAHTLSVVVEGALDRAVLLGLQDAGLLEQGASFRPIEGSAGGTTTLVARGAPLLKTGLAALFVRDLDRGEYDDHASWFRTELEAQVDVTALSAEADGRVLVANVKGDNVPTRAVLVIAGLPGDDALVRLGVKSFTLDDYVLRLAMDRQVYESTGQLGQLVDYDRAWNKMKEVRHLFDANGIPLDGSKRLLETLRAITGFAVAPATFAQRVLDSASAANVDLQALAAPLAADFALGSRLARGRP